MCTDGKARPYSIDVQPTFGADTASSLMLTMNVDSSWLRQMITESINSLGMLAPDLTEFQNSVFDDFRRRLPDFIRIAAISALLPYIEARAAVYYRRQTLAPDLSEEMARVVLQRVLESLRGGWPHGNIGAWVAAISHNELCQHFRKKARETRVLRRQVPLNHIGTQQVDRSGGLDRLLLDLPPTVQAHYEWLHSRKDGATSNVESKLGEAELMRWLYDSSDRRGETPRVKARRGGRRTCN